MRVLAISSAERLPGLDAPTLREQGVDVEFENWRSVVAPPGISARRSRSASRRRSTRWCSRPSGARRSTRYRWLDRYLAGDDVRALRRRRGGARARHPARSSARASDDGADVARGPVSAVRARRACVLFGARRRRSARRGARAASARADAARPRLAAPSCWSRPASCSTSLLAERGGLRDRVGGALLVDRARVRRRATRARRGFARRRRRSAPTCCSRALLQLPLPAGVLAGWLLSALERSDDASQRARRSGFASALTLPHLAWALAGTTLGTAVGVLPGIGPALTVAVLLPVTFSLDPISAFIMFGGIYYGAMYGGSTTSILLNTPGETASIATAIDGHMMARQGRGAAALTTAAIGSFVAGTLATHRADVLRAAARVGRAALRAGRVLRADDARVHDGRGAARRVARARAVQPVSRPRARPGRHRSAHRRRALLVRHPAAARRHRRRDPRDRPVRRRRDAVPGVAARARRGRARVDAARLHRHEPRGLAAVVEAVAARHGDRLSARRAAVRRLGDPDVPLLHGRRSA